MTPTLGYVSKEWVKTAIEEIYSIAHRIAPIDIPTSKCETNIHWEDVYKMAHLSNGITRDFLAACGEIDKLKRELDELKNNHR